MCWVGPRYSTDEWKDKERVTRENTRLKDEEKDNNVHCKYFEEVFMIHKSQIIKTSYPSHCIYHNWYIGSGMGIFNI